MNVCIGIFIFFLVVWIVDICLCRAAGRDNYYGDW